MVLYLRRQDNFQMENLLCFHIKYNYKGKTSKRFLIKMMTGFLNHESSLSVKNKKDHSLEGSH